MASFDAIMALVVIVLVLIVGYYIFMWFSEFPITDCSKYGKINTIGNPGGPTCDPGASEYLGLCYNDVWTKEGGVKTAVCTVEYNESFDTYTECGIGIYDLYIGDACDKAKDWPKNMGPGWHKTAACTCQRGGVVTASQYCQLAKENFPYNCPKGSDYFESACYTDACPPLYQRSEICTCRYVGDVKK